MEYRFGDHLPVDGVPEGTNLLISGPPMTGKCELLLTILASSCDNVVLISTRNEADRVRDDIAATPARAPELEVGVVDCVSEQRNLGTVEESDLTKFVSSPENLTQIGVKFTVLFEQFYDQQRGEQTGVGIHSLSHLLMYSDVKRVYQFLQVLNGKVQSAGWLGVAVLDPTIHDEQTRHTIKHHYDGTIETRQDDAGQRELRVTGLSPQATDWVPF